MTPVTVSPKEKAQESRATPMLSKAEVVYEAMKENILEGRLPPGERLVESELTERFGVSKTPVREALTKLKQGGLARGSIYRGMTVVRPSVQDVLAACEVREVLEGLVARGAAHTATFELCHTLAASIAEQETARDERRFYELTNGFHEILLRHCGNPVLQDVLERLYEQNRLLNAASCGQAYRVPEEESMMTVAEHRKIAQAIAEGNAELAAHLATEHMKDFHERRFTGRASGRPEEAASPSA